MIRENRDRCISAGFELCVVSILAILLLLPSTEFVPLLPAELGLAVAPILAAGLILLLVGCLAKADRSER